MAKGVHKRRVQVASAILVIVLLAGFTVWLAPWPSNCKRAAAPILEALERYHKTHGRYPASLDDLVHEKWIPAIPETTWNLGVRHPFGFEYFAEAELDFFCLGYAEYQLPIDDDGKQISYVSFRGDWDDTPGVPWTEGHRLPIERAGELFQESRSSSHLRLLIKKVLEYRRHGFVNPWDLYWEDIAKAVGNVVPCTVDGSAGVCVEADDHEGAAFGFLINPVQAQLWDKHEILLISERKLERGNIRWREVFRTAPSPRIK